MTISRTAKQIENDTKRIKEAAKTARNMKELEKITGLSYSMIKTTLLKHPIISNRIRDQLLANNQKFLQEQKQKKLEAKQKTELNTKSQEDKSKYPIFVLDASLAEIDDLEKYLLKLCSSKSKVVLTSITIKELRKIQASKQIDCNNAQYILNLATQRKNNFEIISIDETIGLSPDKCIIQYCANNKENLTLLTAKKEMYLLAQNASVDTFYFEPKKDSVQRKIMTLYSSSKIGNNLLISNFNTKTKSIRVSSNNIEYNDGIIELHIGDDVYISIKKYEYITFAHYKIIALSAENNCELLYSKRFYNYDEINLPKAEYEAFVKDFVSKTR